MFRARRQICTALFILGTVSVLAQTPTPPQTGQAPPATPAGTLPVRRVVLYKTGVGYFEHLGNVRNRQDVTVRFTSAQLNDVLKSLTTIDLGKGQITGISYNSIAPIEQRLGALRLPLGAGATTVDLLGSLRGARLEVGAGVATVTGRLLSVERQAREKGQTTVTIDTLSLVTDDGDVRSFDLTPALRLRILDGGLRQEVSRYLDVVGSARAGCQADGDLDIGHRRPAALRQLHQRSADLEDDLSTGAEGRRCETAAARLGDHRQHHR